jgi:hypothetical protein
MIFEDTSERRVLVSKKKSTNSRRLTSNKPLKDEPSVCYYTDIELGLYLIRGDTTVLMGEVDDENDDDNDGDTMEGRTKRKNMVPLTLEEFEILKDKLSDENKDSEDVMETLIWDFDSDLVV